MSETLKLEVVPVESAEEAVKNVDIAMCATNTLEPVFFERWVEPGMHLSSIKRPEIESAAVKRADVFFLHSNDGKPIHVLAKDIKVEEASGDKGWGVGKDIDFVNLPTLPLLCNGSAYVT